MENSNLNNMIKLFKKSVNKIIPIMIVIFIMQIGFGLGPIVDSVKAGNNTQDITVTVTDYYTGELIDGVTITFDHRGNKPANVSIPKEKGKYTVACDPNGNNDVTVSMSTDTYSKYVVSSDNYVESYLLNAVNAFSYVVNPNNTTLGIRLISKGGVKINVNDSSNQKITEYTNNAGETKNYIFNDNPVRLAADATAKISYNFTGVSFSKYKFVQASDLNTPQFPQDSAMINIDLPVPNTQEAYANDIGQRGYITTKQYNYAGNPSLTSNTGASQITRDVSFGSPLGNGVLVQKATIGNNLPAPSVSGSNAFLNNLQVYDDPKSNKDATHYVKASWNGKYYKPTKNAAWKAMKFWGYFAPQNTGSYNIGASSDDGAYGYLIVNGVKQIFVNDWTIAAADLNNPRTTNNTLNLEAGKYYPIYMEWYEGCPTNAAFIPRYQYNGGSFVNIPQNEFYSSNTTTPGDIAGAYFGDISGIKFPAQDGIYYMATKFVSTEGTTSGLYGPFIIDNTKPALTNLEVTSNNTNGNKWALAGNTLTIKFTASENLSSNPQILINGYAVNSTITKDSQNNYTATVSIGSDSSINSSGDKLTDGPITVTVGHYSDLSGNEGNSVQDLTVIYDNTAPTVAITYSANPAGVGPETITATYSEPVNSRETPLISINQQGSQDISNATMTAVGTDRKVWKYDYTVSAANGSTYKDGTATVSLSTVHDAAGNAAAAPTGNTFTINTAVPTVILTYSSDPVKAGIETITATYSAPVKANQMPKISINQQGTADISNVTMTIVGTDRKTWKYNYTVHTDDGNAYKDGEATVTLLSVTTDVSNNSAAAPQANKFTIDTKAPSVALTYSANPTGAGTETITATYSEAVKSGETPLISIAQQGSQDISNATMTVVGTDRKVWKYDYTVCAADDSNYKDGTATVSLSTVHDEATNEATAPIGNTFDIDTTPPTAVIGTPSQAITNNGPITYTVTYSGADKITLNSSNVSLVKTGTADGTVTASGTENTRTVTVSNITGDGTLGIRIAAGTASDNAGNSALAPSDSATFTVCNTGPVITLTPSTTNWTNADVAVTVSASAVGNGNGIAAIKWLAGTKTTADFAGATGTGISGSTFTASSNGVYTVYAKDNLGNESVQIINITNIDRICPTVTLTQTPTTVTNGNVTINVSTADSGSGIAATKWATGNQTLSYFTTGGTVFSGTTFTAETNGIYTVYAVDNAGNAAVQTITISNIDKTVPAAPVITSPTDGTVTKNNTPVISGTGEKGATVTVYDTDGTTVIGTAQVDDSGNWSLTPSTGLADGEHIITAKQTDGAGNASENSTPVKITIETTPSSILKQGIYMSNNANNEYISTNSNNEFDVVKTIPVNVAMIVDVQSSNSQISLKVDGSLKNTSIKFNKYKITKDSTTNKYTIVPGSILQSYTPSSYSQEITFTNNSNFSLDKGSQYIIFYSLTPNGNKGDNIKIWAAVDSTGPVLPIQLNIEDLPVLQ